MKQGTDRIQHVFWVLLLLITCGEMLIATPYPQAGIILHGFLLVGLLTFSGVAQRAEVRNLALALSLAPMIRLLSLALPLPLIPQMAWYPAVSILLMLSFWLITRSIGITRQQLNIRIGNVPLQLALSLVGLGLGAAEYLILQPAPQQMPSIMHVVLMSLSLLIFTGLVEELIFRGLLQSLAPLVLGRWGFGYVAILFGVLHIGYLSFADVVFAGLVGLMFAQLVRWGSSLFGVTLAHGLTNITLFLALPWLAQQPFVPMEIVILVLLMIGGATFILVGSFMAIQHSFAGSTKTTVASATLRDLRRAHGLSYLELATRASVPARRVAEFELGQALIQNEDLGRIARALGVAPEQLYRSSATS